MKLADILDRFEKIAPLGLALSWDNVGLLVGERDATVNKALVSLDFTPNTLSHAIESEADLILTHHPIWLKGIKRLNDPLILELIRHNIALVSFHTNLDTARYSVNHALADVLKLKVADKLSSETGNQQYMVQVTVPIEQIDQVREAAFAVGGGIVGDFDRCCARLAFQGTFRPLEAASLITGVRGIENHIRQEKLELQTSSSALPAVLAAIRKVHPYEQPYITHFPVQDPDPALGLGLICTMEQKLKLRELAEYVRDRLGAPQLRLWLGGHSETAIPERIAICGGSGGSLIPLAQNKADVFISGDFSYHSLLDSSLPLIDAGHFHTERPVLDYLQKVLKSFGVESAILPDTEHEYNQRNRWI